MTKYISLLTHTFIHLRFFFSLAPALNYATSRKVAGSIPDEVIGFFNWPNPSSRTMALGSTQPLMEMSTRNLLGGEGRPAHEAHKLTAICTPVV
jgi:hypothetical protein